MKTEDKNSAERGLPFRNNIYFVHWWMARPLPNMRGSLFETLVRFSLTYFFSFVVSWRKLLGTTGQLPNDARRSHETVGTRVSIGFQSPHCRLTGEVIPWAPKHEHFSPMHNLQDPAPQMNRYAKSDLFPDRARPNHRAQF